MNMTKWENKIFKNMKYDCKPYVKSKTKIHKNVTTSMIRQMNKQTS